MWTQAAVKVMHLCGNTNNISRVRRLVRIALLLTFVRHWNTSSVVTWMTRHSFCTAQKNQFMTCFISWLVSLGISCLVFVHPVLWLGTGPWPPHISRCQHFVWSSNTYNYSDGNSKWAGLGGKKLQSLAISGAIHTSKYGIFEFQKRLGIKTKRTMKPIWRLKNGSLQNQWVASRWLCQIFHSQFSKHRTANRWKTTTVIFIHA